MLIIPYIVRDIAVKLTDYKRDSSCFIIIQLQSCQTSNCYLGIDKEARKCKIHYYYSLSFSLHISHRITITTTSIAPQSAAGDRLKAIIGRI